jgi:ferredoxin-type protein NapH
MKPLRIAMSTRQRLRRATIFASFLLFPLTLNYFSPVLIVQGAITGAVTASAITFGALFLSGLVFGRGFCGWVCPGAGLQEPLRAVNPDAVTGQMAGKVKWILWIPWLMAILTCYGLAVAANPAGLRLEPFFQMKSWVSVDRPAMLIPYFTVLALIVWPALALGRRGFCHSLCWMAPFLILGTRAGERLGLVRLRLGVETSGSGGCDGCSSCERACPMSLPVSSMAASGTMRHAECVLCGECADVCPRGAIALGFTASSDKP